MLCVFTLAHTHKACLWNWTIPLQIGRLHKQATHHNIKYKENLFHCSSSLFYLLQFHLKEILSHRFSYYEQAQQCTAVLWNIGLIEHPYSKKFGDPHIARRFRAVHPVQPSSIVEVTSLDNILNKIRGTFLLTNQNKFYIYGKFTFWISMFRPWTFKWGDRLIGCLRWSETSLWIPCKLVTFPIATAVF